jgi:hypothetical protein
MKCIIAAVLLMIVSANVLAQMPDSLQKRLRLLSAIKADTAQKDSLLVTKKIDSLLTKAPKHSPRKATIYSLSCPGLGQIYNKQYWKTPFVYAGLGAVVYMFRYNNLRYQDFVKQYIDSYDAKTNSFKATMPVYIRSQNITRELTQDQIVRGKDLYRRYRDLNVIIFIGVWALNAIEANVSAHLKTFDVSDDLTLRIRPSYDFSSIGGITGVKISLNYK